ncbi:hypothetical protein KR222_000688 [Zaprionus bogoriensis]|nr:hypothetical protein KR222_000688 [Zaprionus bogoriensis]
MSSLVLKEDEEQSAQPNAMPSNSIWINASKLSMDFELPSESDGVQSAPELSAIRLMIHDPLKFPLERECYCACEETTSKKKRKRRVDVFNCVKLKRKKCHLELRKITLSTTDQLLSEVGYEADAECE